MYDSHHHQFEKAIRSRRVVSTCLFSYLLRGEGIASSARVNFRLEAHLVRHPISHARNDPILCNIPTRGVVSPAMLESCSTHDFMQMKKHTLRLHPQKYKSRWRNSRGAINRACVGCRRLHAYASCWSRNYFVGHPVALWVTGSLSIVFLAVTNRLNKRY